MIDRKRKIVSVCVGKLPTPTSLSTCRENDHIVTLAGMVKDCAGEKLRSGDFWHDTCISAGMVKDCAGEKLRSGDFWHDTCISAGCLCVCCICGVTFVTFYTLDRLSAKVKKICTNCQYFTHTVSVFCTSCQWFTGSETVCFLRMLCLLSQLSQLSCRSSGVIGNKNRLYL